jgi:hypothetical protein
MSSKKVVLTASLLSAMLTACGGAGGDAITPTNTPTPTAAPTATPAPVTAQGIWKESHTDASNGNSLEETAAVLLENGTAITLAWSNGTLNDLNITNYNYANQSLSFSSTFEADPLASMTLSSFSLSGAVSSQGLTLRETGASSGLTLNAVGSTPAKISDVVGTYTGKSYAGAGTTYLNVADGFKVLSDGSIVDNAVTSCRFSGQLTPSTKMNAFTFTLTFNPSGCVLNGQTVTGIAFKEPFRNKLVAFGANAAKNQGLYFEGSK